MISDAPLENVLMFYMSLNFYIATWEGNDFEYFLKAHGSKATDEIHT